MPCLDRPLRPLLQHYRPRLVRYFARQHGAAAAEDLTQQTLLVAVLAVRRGGSQPFRFGPYAFAVARRLGARAHADRRRRAFVPLVEAPTPTLPAEALERAPEARRLLRQVASLPDHYRTALELYYLEDAPAPDVARRLRIPIATVRSRIHRALARLREANNCAH